MENSKKKAQLEVSFNWIFILIAGAVILFFFLRIISNETDYTQDVVTNRFSARLESLLTAIEQNPNTISTHPRITQEVEFTCNIEGHSYSVKNSLTRTYIEDNILFTPPTIGESELVAWVKTYKSPYPVSSILYLTDLKTQYIFIKNEPETLGAVSITNLYNLLPDNVSKVLVKLDEYKDLPDNGHRNYILILDRNLVLNNVDFANNNNRLHRRISGGIVITQHEIKFYKLDNANNKFSHLIEKDYYSMELAQGAIVTGNPELYDCVVNKLLDKTRIATEINLAKTILIQERYPPGQCRTLYGLVTQNAMTNLTKAAKEKDFDNMRKEIAIIENANNQMLRTSCVTLY